MLRFSLVKKPLNVFGVLHKAQIFCKRTTVQLSNKVRNTCASRVFVSQVSCLWVAHEFYASIVTVAVWAVTRIDK